MAEGLSTKLRIAIDGRKIGDGGIGVYVEHLIAELSTRPEVDLTVLTSSVRKRPPALGRDIPPQVRVVPTAIAPFSFGEMFRLGAIIDSLGVDLYHSPHFCLPFGTRTRSVITVHDLIPLGSSFPLAKRLVTRALLSSSIRRADRIVSVSRSSERDLFRFLGGRADLMAQIKVIPNVSDPALLSAPPNNRADRVRRLVAVISTDKPHKGLPDLEQAWAGLPAATKQEWSVVVVGQGVNARPSVEGIRFRGAVSRSELVDLIGTSAGLIVASREEGFCLPALDAQLLHTPVIARPLPVLLEILPAGSGVHAIAAGFTVGDLQDALQTFMVRYDNGKRGGQWPHDDVSTAHLKRLERTAVVDSLLELYRELLGSRNVAIFQPEVAA